jgi:O-antigen ligase
MATLPIASGVHLSRLTKIADGLAVAIAVSVPWSTSATSILLVLWLIALIPTLTWSDVRRQLTTAVGGLPVLLFLLGAVGVLWADVTWHARWGGLDSFAKLLVIPLLMAQFRRSDGGHRVFIGFLIACVAVLVASVIVTIWPNIEPGRGGGNAGVPVKSYILQSAEFAMCAAILVDLAVMKARLWRWKPSAAFAVLALAFLCNIFFITTGRTALVIIPVLAVLYGIQHSGWKGVFGAVAALLAVAAIVWSVSPYLRERVTGVYSEIKLYEQQNKDTSSGERIQFWKQSIRSIEDAPLLGHGTGSIADQFLRAPEGQPSAHGTIPIISANPHNQTFAVGIQLGLIGIAVLWAMWISQVTFFWGNGSLAWVGLVIVTANIVGSLFNSFIFDFTEGWLYVVGVGVAAGMLQQPLDAAPRRCDAAAASAAPGS